MDTSLIKYHINSWYFLQILTILLDIWDFTFKGWLNKEKYHKTQCWLIFRLILANKQLNDWRRAGHWIYCLFNLFRGEMWTAVERERERARDFVGFSDLIVLHPLLGEGSQYPGLYSPSVYRRPGEWWVVYFRNYRLLLLEAGHDEGWGRRAGTQSCKDFHSESRTGSRVVTL